MVFYVLAVLVEYVIAFGLALLLNAQIRARKFFRVVFLMPLMLSPVAVSWMIGKSLMENRFGPLATLARQLGWDSPAFFTSPEIARLSIMVMDAWTFIPLMMIMLLAGLQALPKEVMEAAEVDGASAWRRFRHVTLPLLRPVIAVVTLFSTIFTFSDFNIVQVLTRGGPVNSTHLFATLAYQVGLQGGNLGQGAAISLFLFPMLAAVVFIQLRYIRRE
jgi:multiple sugar transport system permease protein